eukprot:scaffold27248_cov133-Isochrysis_galbana.AAC.9
MPPRVAFTHPLARGACTFSTSPICSASNPARLSPLRRDSSRRAAAASASARCTASRSWETDAKASLPSARAASAATAAAAAAASADTARAFARAIAARNASISATSPAFSILKARRTSSSRCVHTLRSFSNACASIVWRTFHGWRKGGSSPTMPTGGWLTQIFCAATGVLANVPADAVPHTAPPSTPRNRSATAATDAVVAGLAAAESPPALL